MFLGATVTKPKIFAGKKDGSGKPNTAGKKWIDKVTWSGPLFRTIDNIESAVEIFFVIVLPSSRKY